MAIEWKYSTEEVDWKELSVMYRAAPLGDKKPSSLTNSMFKCFVYERGRLVGAGRALADGADCSYLVERSRGHRKIILYAVPGREPFYRKFGFMRMTTAMAIFENQQQLLERGFLSET